MELSFRMAGMALATLGSFCASGFGFAGTRPPDLQPPLRSTSAEASPQPPILDPDKRQVLLQWSPPPQSIGCWETSSDARDWSVLGGIQSTAVAGIPLKMTASLPEPVACAFFRFRLSPSEGREPGRLRLDDFAHWRRHGAPVLRDPEPGGEYEVAADPHVFRTPAGELRMVYSGPHPENEFGTIKLASGSKPSEWAVGSVLLTGSHSGGLDLNKETAFYRLSASGRHQIYYIGYADVDVYNSQIFVAEADALEGPYTLPEAPVIPTGLQAGHDVATMTSPSIVAQDGILYMVYCAWDAFPDPTTVWVHGATSSDDGRTWEIVGEVPVPSCMEGSITRGPDGFYYAVAQTEGGFSIARSTAPFGPYTERMDSVMTPVGAPWELDEMNTPQLFFDGTKAYLYYSGADYRTGWWVLLASADLTH